MTRLPTISDGPRELRPPTRRAELIDGQTFDSGPPGYLHARIQARAMVWLFAVAEASGGTLLGDCGFVLARDPDTILAPDLAYIEPERLGAGPPSGFLPFAPTVAIEIIAPDDTFALVERKADCYLAAGSRAVWVISPTRQRVMCFTPDGAVRVLGPDAILAGGQELPGLELPVRMLFE